MNRRASGVGRQQNGGVDVTCMEGEEGREKKGRTRRWQENKAGMAGIGAWAGRGHGTGRWGWHGGWAG